MEKMVGSGGDYRVDNVRQVRDEKWEGIKCWCVVSHAITRMSMKSIQIHLIERKQLWRYYKVGGMHGEDDQFLHDFSTSYKLKVTLIQNN